MTTPPAPPSKDEAGEKTAGDLLLERIDLWIEHGVQCSDDDCTFCSVSYNQMRLAWKVWRNSRHRQLSDVNTHATRQDAGLAETERRHSLDCRQQEAQRQREADILQAGLENGKAAADAALQTQVETLTAQLAERSSQRDAAVNLAAYRRRGHENCSIANGEYRCSWCKEFDALLASVEGAVNDN